MSIRHLLIVLFLCHFSHVYSRPNILFILTDDQSCSSIGCYGGKLVGTPHLDDLAERGIRFTDAYVMPQCTPTRAALLSGQHTARNGMWHVIPWYGSPFAPVSEPAFREQLDPGQCRLPCLLREAGYVTGMGGKWHLTTNPKVGYYTFLKEEAANQFGFDHVAPPGPGSQNEGDKWVGHLTEDAIQFIRKNREQPWFYLLSHHTLHGKVSAPKELVDEFRQRGAPETGMGNATYLAAIKHLDSSVGRLIDALAETQQTERTLIVFLSDNGGVDTIYHHTADDGGPLDPSKPLQIKNQEFESAPLREGKGSMYEGGIRVPCLVTWPNTIKAGQVVSKPIHVVDWLPTLLDVAELGVESTEDGVSLLPLFRGQSESLPERSLYWYMPLYDLRWASTPCAVIRSGDWKLIDFFGDRFDAEKHYQPGPHTELYNLRTDPGETTDLATKQPERVATMKRELRDWIQELGATIPRSNPAHDPNRSFLEVKEKPEHIGLFQTREP